MLNIYVYAAKPELANKAVEQLRVAGADRAEVLPELKITSRPPKDNRYLFICETPADMLRALAPKVLPEADYAQELGQWYEAQNQVVTTATAQKKRSIVITSAQLGDANSLLTSINDEWESSLKVQEAEAPSVKREEPLLAYLVQNLIEQTGPLQALQCQIDALAGIDNESLHETDALIGYRGLVQRQAELQSQNHQLASTQAELNNQLKDLTKEKADLTAARDNQTKTAADKQKQIEVLIKERSDLAAARDGQAKATKEATEEAELLLNQLHQVQEELEHYFLKNQEAEAKLDKQQARWQRLLKKHPDYIDTDSTRVELIDPTTQTFKWVVEGLESQGICKDYLEFDTFIESGILGFRFRRNNSRKEPTLNNWPASSKGETIDCIPAGKGTVMRQRALALRELSASDWKLLNTLPQLIKQNQGREGLDAKLYAAITNAANKFTHGINALPKVFRYDTVTLKSNKVNPDYEHLWFELHNASYDTYHWPKFEFRLGASNIKPGQFSRHPKLELPLIDGKIKPFESWFEESCDEHGGKFEVRYDLNRGIADTETLMKLNGKDQKLVSTLAALLPSITQSLGTNGFRIGRPTGDWAELAVAVCRIVPSK